MRSLHAFNAWYILLIVAPLFVDIAAQSGISFTNQPSVTSRKYLPESMVGGVAVLDYDGDGRLDIFFVNGAMLRDPMPKNVLPDKSNPRFWNRLYHNNGNGTFTDVTEKSGVRGEGYGMGVAVADYDDDGRPDLYVTNVGANILYHNNGNGTFRDVTGEAGVAGGGWSAGAAFVDYDRDGRLDLVVARYLTWDFSKDVWCGAHRAGFRAYCTPDIFPPITHCLFHNEGGGHFRDVSRVAGFAKAPGKGLGVAINDYDRDGWPDILIANDSVAQQLFHNLKNGTFEEVGLSSGLAYDDDGQAFSGMGADFADYDNDGWPDVFIDALGNQRYALFRNLKGAFQYVSDPVGISRATRSHSGWGAAFFDYDNDGWKDLFVGQGHVMDNIQLTQPNLRYLEQALLLRNERGSFTEIAAFDRKKTVRGAAFGDLDDDGCVDIVLNNLSDRASVLHNACGKTNHWLTLNTIGTASNRDGIGAKIKLVTAAGEQYGMVSTASSYLSANDKRVHFGLGRESAVRELEITWPSGAVNRLTNVPVDQIINVRERSSAAR
jgi:enediyne biosynthesis protein E4